MTTTNNTCCECDAPIPSPTRNNLYWEGFPTEFILCTPCAHAYDKAEEALAEARYNSDWEEVEI